VAHLAQVSTATVSKVLSDTPYVTPETRARVLEAIAELGYVPNIAARALSKGRTYIIGVIFRTTTTPVCRSAHVVGAGRVETACTERGYNMLLSTPRIPLNDSEQYQRLVNSSYFDGVIALETLPGEPVSTALEEHGYVWIAIGYAPCWVRKTPSTVTIWRCKIHCRLCAATWSSAGSDYRRGRSGIGGSGTPHGRLPGSIR
jgi:DNA-binding LacI/PurR family transcriptional regulator